MVIPIKFVGSKYIWKTSRSRAPCFETGWLYKSNQGNQTICGNTPQISGCPVCDTWDA